MPEQRIDCPKCQGRGERDHRPCILCWGAGSLTRKDWEKAAEKYRLGPWPICSAPHPEEDWLCALVKGHTGTHATALANPHGRSDVKIVNW
jgi:hypothetical protein